MGNPKSDVTMDLPDDAKQQARKLVAQLRHGKNVESDIRLFEEFFTGKSYEAFMDELFSGLYALGKEKGTAGVLTSSGTTGRTKQSGLIYKNSEHTWIVPRSLPITTNNGFVLRIVAGKIEETAMERSIEIYTDHSAGWEAGIELKKGPAKFKVGVGGKVGVKASAKTTAKKTYRNMVGTEKSFKIISLRRDVIEIEWNRARQISVVPWNINWSSSEWTLKSVNTKANEIGYKIVVNPSGNTLGFYWPDYSRHKMTDKEIRKAALQKVLQELEVQKKIFAEHLLLMH